MPSNLTAEAASRVALQEDGRHVVEAACAFVDWFKQSVVRPVCSDGKIATVATSSLAVDSDTFTDGRTVNPAKQRGMDNSDAC